MNQKTAELIKAATVNRILDKATGACLGYAVKSNSSAAYYHVTASRLAGEWKYFCTCRAGQDGFKRCKAGACCHVLAVKEVVAARKAMQQEEAAPTASLASYDVQAAAVAVVASVENAALDEAYVFIAKAQASKAAAKTQPRPVACDECFERGNWQEQGGKHLCPECSAEMARPHATCDYCGRNHASSECYL